MVRIIITQPPFKISRIMSRKSYESGKNMRVIDTKEIENAVRDLFIKANRYLPEDVKRALQDAHGKEEHPRAKVLLSQLCENFAAAEETGLPVCQDTGMAVVFIDLGQEVHLTGDLLETAVNRGVARAYEEGYLRKSVVKDPLLRENTNDNTPAILHLRIVEGNRVRILAVPKGFGSENMSAVRMFTPAATKEDIIDFVVETVKTAGGNPCPPVTVGVGIGGTMEMAALIAKRALTRPLDKRHPHPFYAEMEEELLKRLNRTGVGPQGMGGYATALGAAIETYPTHIAGLPVAVNMGCHAARHAEITL